MLAQAIGTPDKKLYSLADFNQPALDLYMPVVVYGVSGAGKTEFASVHFDCPLIVRRRDDLKRANFRTDGIIFDDVDLSDWSVEEVIHLLSIEKNRSISARYADAHLEAFTPIIFTTNKKPKDLFPRATGEQKRALKRRYRAVKVTGSLQQLGRPFTAAEMQARRSTGRNGPQGPPAQQRNGP